MGLSGNYIIIMYSLFLLKKLHRICKAYCVCSACTATVYYMVTVYFMHPLQWTMALPLVEHLPQHSGENLAQKVSQCASYLIRMTCLHT